MIPEKIWTYRKTDKEKAAVLAEALQVSRITASLLFLRGIHSPAAAQKFLAPSLDDLLDPFLLTDMRKAVERILHALDKGEQILIYGDYDADGITAVALLYSCLQDMEGQVSFYIPSRFDEGYGLHTEAILMAAEKGIGLIITVDCGENAAAEIAAARNKGIDIIVTDHHQPQGERAALAHINPLREAAGFPLRTLAGVGVAFKVAQALHAAKGQKAERWHKYLDLVALGTVADIVPLLGENRILVKYGLQVINEKRRPGLQALIEAAALGHKDIEAGHISFILAPRLNAAGRMGEAWPGVKLLTTPDAATAARIAEELNEVNKKRQQVEQQIFEAARSCLEAESLPGMKVLVHGEEGWHQGVLGIVASRLSELYVKPVVLLSLDGQGQAKGSGRSMPGFNLVESLQAAAPLLERFGGHELAAGLTLKAENIGPLRERLNALADSTFAGHDGGKKISLDTHIEEDELNLSLAEELSLLSPFGFGNPQPLLGGSFRILEKRRVGKNGSHLKLVVEDNRREKYSALYFRNGSQGDAPLRHRRVDLAFFPEASTWRGRKELALLVKQLAFSDVHADGGLSMVDHRNSKKKVYLQELLKYNPGNIMVYVNTRQEEALLAPMAKEAQASLLHQGRGALLGGAVKEGHLALWSLPMREDILLPLLASIREVDRLHVHLLYGEEDYRQNQRLLKASLPGEEILEELFAALSQSRTALPPNIDMLKKHLERALAFPVTRFSVQRALAIMEEANLVSLAEGGFSLNTEDFSGESLKESSLFREDSATLERCRNFQEYLLYTDKEELGVYFRREYGKS